MTWLSAEEPEAQGIMVAVNGRLLGACLGADPEAGLVKVVPATPLEGGWPYIMPTGNGFATECLKLPLEIVREKPEHWIYWTGDGWLDETSNPIEGPEVEVTQ